MVRRCVFCGSQPTTKEHGLPRWVDTFFNTPPLDSTQISDDFVPRAHGQRNTVSGYEIRAVCKSCNGGWLSILESEARPIIGPMVAGCGTVLNRDAQNTVATWVIKTCLILALRNPKKQQTASIIRLCESLFAERRSLEHFQIAVGAYTRDKFETIHHFQPHALVKQSESMTLTIDAHFSTLVIGNFVAQAWYMPDVVFTIHGPSLRMIYPYEDDFIWPPGSFLSTEQLEPLAYGVFPAHPDEPLPPVPPKLWTSAD